MLATLVYERWKRKYEDKKGLERGVGDPNNPKEL